MRRRQDMLLAAVFVVAVRVCVGGHAVFTLSNAMFVKPRVLWVFAPTQQHNIYDVVLCRYHP